MEKNDRVKKAAATAKLQLEAGKSPAQVFAEIYTKFSVEFELIVKEIVRFDLLKDHLQQFTKVQLQYTSIKTRLGLYCTHITPRIHVLKLLLENFMKEGSSISERDVMDFALTTLKSKAKGAGQSVIEEMVEGSLGIVNELIKLLDTLEVFKLNIEKHPHYKKQNYANLVMGITGAVCLAAGLVLLFTPLAVTAPVVVTYGAHIAAAGGAIAVIGGTAFFKGFAKTAVDTATKKAIIEYIEQKQKQLSDLKAPCLDHYRQAAALELMIQSEFPGGISTVTLAQYLDSFDVFEAAFLRKGPPQQSLTEIVRRFLSSRKTILQAVTGATVVTAVVTAVSAHGCIPP